VKIFRFVIIIFFIYTNLQSQINNVIVVKVGESLITSIDIQNEIMTNIIVNNKEINQKNIDNSKNYAIQNLINKSIKQNEIKKYEVTSYNKKDLDKYIINIANNLSIDQKELKNLFKQNGLDYESFVEKHKTELLWNSLIFKLYKNQTNINIVDVENEINKVKSKMSDEEVKKIRKKILDQKKEEKLNLFSRSHYSSLENTVIIDFQ
jgi:hypothetical protein